MTPDFLFSNPGITAFSGPGAALPRPQPQQTVVRPSQPVRTPAPQQQPQAQPVRTQQKPQQQQKQQPQKNQGHASILHDITHNPVTNFVGNDVVKPTAKGAAQFVNQGIDEGRQVVDTAHQMIDTHNQSQKVKYLQAAEKAHNPAMIADANRQLGIVDSRLGADQATQNKDFNRFGSKGGLFNQGTITTKKEAQQGTAHGALKIAGDTAMLGSWLIPGAGGAAEKGAPLLARVGMNSLRGAATGGLYGAGNTLGQGGSFKDALKNGLMQGAMGSTLGGGGTLLAGGARAAIQRATGKFAGKDVSKIPEGQVVNKSSAKTSTRTPYNPDNAPKNMPLSKADFQQAQEDMKLSPQEKGDLPPDRQMKLAQLENKGPQTNKQILNPKKLAATDEANPVKTDQLRSSLSSINANDKGRFEHAQATVRTATEPIKIAGFLAKQSAKDANLTVKDLADRVEHPEDYKNMSPKEAQAVADWQHLTNLVNSTSHALGGKEARLDNFFKHAVDTQGWAHTGESAVFEGKSGKAVDNFKGVDAISRKVDESGNIKYPDLRSLHDAGMKLQNEDNIGKFIDSYAGSAAYKVEKQAIRKAFGTADVTAEKQTRLLDFRDGSDGVKLSPQAYKYARTMLGSESSLAGKIIDKPSNALKHILLSTSQYHPINVNVLQSAPALALEGHPIMAAKGLGDTFVNAVNKGRSISQMRTDLHNGLVADSARIGSPLYKTDFTANGETPKMGQMVFGRQIPAMQRQTNMATIKDLNRGKWDLNSSQARAAGTVAYNKSGFYKATGKMVSPGVQKNASRLFLAPQFEFSKLNLVKTAFDPRTPVLARRNALAAILGKYGTEVGVGVGVGAALGQKHDSVSDVAKREFTNPYIPTPFTDNHVSYDANGKPIPGSGNTIKFKLPDSGQSEIANLFLGQNRQQNGHIGFTANNPAQVASNVAADARGKFSPLFGAGVKLATNENYAGKPLHQTNVPAGTQAEQSAATLTTDLLPIGLQGAVYTKPVESHLPGNVQNVLEANKPGSNAFLKSGMTTLTATPQTDQTTGKGLQSAQYYKALGNASKTLTPGSPAYGAFLESFGITKDPVTGKYIQTPNSNMTVAKSSSLNAYPDAAKAANQMAQELAKGGQKVDPYYLLTPDQQKAYNSYMTMAPLSGDRTDWENKNKSWYDNFSKQQQSYFAGLPKGDPNKPANPIKYPEATKEVQDNLNYYYGLPKGSKEATQFLNDHPDVVSHMADVTNYDNAVRTARGYAAIKQAPQASQAVTTFMNKYNAADKATRTQMRTANPQMYQAMVANYDNQDLASLDKQASVSQLQGEPDYTSKELHDITSLAGDVYDTGQKDANGKAVYTIAPAAWATDPSAKPVMSSSGSGGGYSSAGSTTAGGYPVFHAPTSIGDTFAKLNSAIKSSEKLSKPKAIKATKISTRPGAVARIKTPHLGSTPHVPRFPRPSKTTSISQSKKTNQRVTLKV